MVNLQEAKNFKEKGEAEKAISKFLEIIELNPENAQAQLELAEIYESTKQPEKAIAHYRRLCEIEPKNLMFQGRLGSLLLQANNTIEAFSCLEKAVTQLEKSQRKPQWLEKWLNKLWGDVLSKKGEINKAIIAYQKVIELAPNRGDIYLSIGNLLICQENWQEAINNYRKAINIKSQQPVWVYINLVKAHQKMGSLDELIPLYKKLIELQPNEPNHYLALAQIYGKYSDKLDEVIKNYKKAIELKPDLPFSIYKTLATILQKSGKELEGEAYLKSAPITKHGEKYLRIWNGLNATNLEILEQAISEQPNITKEKNTLEAYFFQYSNYIIINLKSLDEKEKKYLNSVGLSIDYLKLNQNLITKEGVVQTSSQIDFQISLVKEGAVYAICPFTGKILKSNHSFPITNSNFCYRFGGKEVFYLFVYEAWNTYCQKSCLYFPRTESIVHITNAGKLVTPELINSWKANMVVHCKKVKSYLNNNNKPVEKAIVLSLNHLGHHFWNELTGIYDLYEANCLDEVDKFLIYSTEFYGKLEELFPEIPSEKIQRCNSAILQVILNNNYFGITLRNKYIKEGLASRIYNVSVKKCSSPCLAQIKEAKKKHFPLLFISIRLGNRMWINQLEGTANIIKNLYKQFPDLGVVFDGISPPINEFLGDSLKLDVERGIKEEKDFLKQMRSLIPSEISIYDLIGAWMHETIIWTNAIDLYLAPFGGGMVKTTWIANKPGVVHSNSLRLNKPDVSYGAFRDNAIRPVYISSDRVVDITFGYTKYGLLDNRNEFLYNYHCDWRIIYEEVLKLALSIKRDE